MLAFLISTAIPALSARVSLSAEDLADLKHICRQLLGSQFLGPSWQKLAPYLRDKHGLDSVGVVCSGSCSGSIALRGDAWFDFTYVNPQKMDKPWGPRDGLVYSVTLSSGRKTILHRKTEPKT